jgi:hypothetical protein
VHLRQDDLLVAEEMLATAEDIASVIGERMVQGRVVLAQADLALRKGDTGKAAEHADWAINDFEDIKTPVLKADALLLRGQIHAAADEPEAALQAWQASLTVLSKLDPRSTHGMVTELQNRISALGGDYVLGGSCPTWP